MPISGVSGYIAVKENDWIRLNQCLKTVWSRLSDLEGRTGASVRYNDLDLEGHKITGGPSAQKTAEEHEFVTKAYLSSQEAASAISQGMANAGITSSAIKIRSVDGGATPSAPNMVKGEIILFVTPSTAYLVHYDGLHRRYFGLSGGTDLF